MEKIIHSHCNFSEPQEVLGLSPYPLLLSWNHQPWVQPCSHGGSQVSYARV